MKIAALDIGGTAIKSGIWNGKETREFREWITNASKGGEYLMERVKSILHTYGEFDAIGIGTAGQVDDRTGSIHYANENIPGYTGMPVRAILEHEFHVPAVVENDVNAAAIGEMYFGAARGLSNFLCLTYGTGIGGAIIMDGALWRGSNFAGGSFGGIMVHPEDWMPGEVYSGCYEKYASTKALVREVKKIDARLTSGKDIFKAIGRREIKSAVDRWIDEIMIGLVTLVHCFDPSALLLGGGILAQPYIMEEVRRKIRQKTSPDLRNIDIRQAALGNRAGITGAAVLAEKRLGECSFL